MSGIAANMKAMCKLLEGDGHMTPIATRQILSVVERWETKPRTVTTLEELDALPRDCVVLSDGFAYQHVRGVQWDGLGRGWSSNQIDLPATILHTPEATS